MYKSYHPMAPSDDTVEGPSDAKSAALRKVPMKVLCLGFPRTGTASLQAALEQLGYVRTAHGFDIVEHEDRNRIWIELIRKRFDRMQRIERADFDRVLGDCQAVTDIPCILFSEDLIEAYPEARVVLTDRDIDAWEKSFNVVIDMVFCWPAYLIYILADPLLGLHGSEATRLIYYNMLQASNGAECRANARETYRRHYARMRELVPAERLLNFRVGEGWQPLCDFLEVKVPDVPFPKINEAAALQERIQKIIAERARNGLRTFFLKVLLPGAVLVAAVASWNGKVKMG